MTALRLSTVLSYCYGKRRLVITTAVIVLLLLEIYLRLPFVLSPLEYQPDTDLGSRLKPGQVGFVWLGNMSYQSAPVAINSDGHRGRETDWSKPVILAVGDSESMGIGVGDAEVWTARLESLLHQYADFREVQVVNASHPGSGPYHHFITMKRALAVENRDIRAIIVRVDIGDRYFKAPSLEQRKQAVQGTEMRMRIKLYTKALPYVLNKIDAQKRSLLDGLKPWFLRKRTLHVAQSESVGRSMWEDNKQWWTEMTKLASSRNIPLIFMIGDVMGWPSTKFITRQLDDLSAERQHTYRYTLGSESLGLSEKDPALLWEEFNSKMTLGRDPHANPLQHRLIAESLYTCIKNEYKLKSYSNEKKSASSNVQRHPFTKLVPCYPMPADR